MDQGGGWQWDVVSRGEIRPVESNARARDVKAMLLEVLATMRRPVESTVGVGCADDAATKLHAYLSAVPEDSFPHFGLVMNPSVRMRAVAFRWPTPDGASHELSMGQPFCLLHCCRDFDARSRSGGVDALSSVAWLPSLFWRGSLF
jgi:hypothetical protein